MPNKAHKNIHQKRALCSLFVFLWALLFSKHLRAQHFTECFNYEVGSVTPYKKVNSFYTSDFIEDELNKKGSGIIWNLHDTEIVYSTFEPVQKIVQANLVNGYNLFVGTNIARIFSGEFDQFLYQDSSGIQLYGEISYPVTKYLNKKKLINYPHGIFECSIDSFTIDSMQNLIGDWITGINGTSQNCFDAEGTIYFKSGIIVPAYRYTRIDTTKYFTNGSLAREINMETYWYESNCNLHTPVIFANGYLDLNGYQHYNSIYILKEYALGLEDNINSNTASFNFTNLTDKLLIANLSNYAQEITLIDISGRVIDFVEINPNEKNASIATHLLSSGIYFLKSSSGACYKISIVH